MGIRPFSASALSRQLENRPFAACFIVFFFTIGIRAALLPVLHVPMPAVHDEFSYLLGGDTFASGRLANPPHPFWKHFESFHVIQQPTYASKYPPMQGFVLALGERIAGQPWIGVWLSAGFMCATLCWMLQGWIAADLAFLGAILAALRFGILSYWMNSYWGGAVPAIGGALVAGALARIVFRRQFIHAVTWAVGVAVLLNSRPYEGAVLSLLTGAVILWKVRPAYTLAARVVVPAAAILIPVAACMLYMNARVTGHAFELPYELHERQYVVVNNFAWSRDNAGLVYNNDVLRDFWSKVNVAQMNGMREHLLSAYLVKVAGMYGFFFCFYPLFIPLLIWPYPLRSPQERTGVLLLVIGLLGLIPVLSFQYHYAATIMPMIYLRVLQSADRLRNWRPNLKPVGLIFVVLLLALIPVQFGRDVWKLLVDGEYAPPMAQPRHDLVRQLEALPGQHLVMVRYSPNHDVDQEWVYNRADIDSSRVVWARELGAAEDAPLIRYFHDRHAWLLEPDRTQPKLMPYPENPGTQVVLEAQQ